MKPGYQTSEFYMTIASIVIGVLVSAGVVDPIKANVLVSAVTTLIGGIITLVPVVVYIINRTWLKSKVAIVQPTVVPITSVVAPIAPLGPVAV